MAIRALERYAILAANGGLVGGLAADGSTLYNSMAPLVAAPHLFHPMVTPLFSGLAKAQATAFNAPMRASMSKINAAFAAFEEARTGDAAYSFRCEIHGQAPADRASLGSVRRAFLCGSR